MSLACSFARACSASFTQEGTPADGGKPGLFPDHFVRVEATGINIPSGSVFRIIRKRWEATHDGEFVTEFACQFETEGT
ncbi:MAG: hypothetical protein FJX75_08415 [Armatimonadetes bacterium]|nr:hypothetical protein [Armatimonadota bacterium]